MVQILLLSLITLPLFAQNTCFRIFGNKINDPYLSSEYDVFALGEGMLTDVVRIVPKDKSQKPWVEKRYHDVPKFMMESGSYEKLAEILSSPGANSSFKMAKAEPQANQTIKLEDIQGVPLDKVLSDSRVSEEIKGSLRALYRMKLNALDRLVKAKYPDAETLTNTFDGLPDKHYIIGDSRNRTEIYVKSSQIIVTFDEADPRKFYMTIVDAY